MIEPGQIVWLIAEYCAHDCYMGWHLYLRESRRYQKRNKDGGWGWIRRPKDSNAGKLLAELGFPILGDGTVDRDGIGQFARAFPFKGKQIGGKVRGGVKVTVGEHGVLSVKESKKR